MSLSCGSTFSAAINDRGDVFVWGNRQIFTPRLYSKDSFFGGEKVIFVSCGSSHILFTTGLASQAFVCFPFIDTLSVCIVCVCACVCVHRSTHAGIYGTLLLCLSCTESGAVFAMGKNTSGQLGSESTKAGLDPQKVKLLVCCVRLTGVGSSLDGPLLVPLRLAGGSGRRAREMRCCWKWVLRCAGQVSEHHEADHSPRVQELPWQVVGGELWRRGWK